MSRLWALLAGAAHAASVAWPLGWGFAAGQSVPWLQVASLLVLVQVLSGARTARQGAWLGWCFGLTSLSLTFWWLFISMHTYGGLAAPLAVLAVLALAGALGLFYAAAAGVYVAWRPVSAAGSAMAFAAVWTLAELARGTWLTGFPWGAGGYAHVDGWLASYATWIGVYGIGALAAWVAAALALLGASAGASRILLLLGLSGVLGWPWVQQFRTPLPDEQGQLPMLEVTLLQGNIAQGEKFERDTGVEQSLRWYRQQLLGATTTLVVAPETAIPLLSDELPEAYWQSLRGAFAQGAGGARAALLGMPMGNEREGYTNAVIGLKPGQASDYRYDKQHLVPFGEFIPSGFKWFTRLMHIPLGDFNRGDLVQPAFAWRGQRLAPNICYEDLFGEELGARFADPAMAPTIFVNVSNLGWFGNSVAIDQHLGIARMRSLEFARPTLRATNTGATVIIDHHGAVTHRLPRLTAGVLTGRVQGRGLNEAAGWEITPYAWWVSRLGLWPLWALALGLMWFNRRRPIPEAPKPLGARS